MSADSASESKALSAVEAGALLDLPADVVRALADAGYLRVVEQRSGSPRFATGDVKALGARLMEGSTSEAPLWEDALDLDELLEPDSLMTMLDGRAEAMAYRTFELFVSVFPEAADYSDAQRDRFLREARERIEAILALCARGPGENEPLEEDFAELGADAAHAGVPLPNLLFSLRSNRDLVVRTAIEVAEERGGRWGLALAVTLTRVLPSIDRVSDALARGYSEALLEIDAETTDRFRNIADRVTDGLFDTDATGVLRYANPVLAGLLGLTPDDLVGRAIDDLLGVTVGAASAEVVVGGQRVRVRQFERLRDGVTVGWDGLVAPAR